MSSQTNKVMNLLDDDDDEMLDSQEGKYLTFIIKNEEFGVKIAYVREIIGIQGITEVPDSPMFVRGVINLRGKVIPVVDVRLRFGMDAREYDERTCIIVLSFEELVTGIVVDTVNEVLNIPAEEIDPAPDMCMHSGNGFIQGMAKVGEKVKMLLDVEKLLWENN